MSSITLSPTLAVSGDVGVLAEENAQRLISIYMEAGMSCILHLRDVVEKELRSKGKDLTTFPKFYKFGLASIGQWSTDMLQAEVADIEAQYPETRKLHQFVFVSVLSEAVYSNGTSNLVIPSISETYHAFLKRLVGSSDVQRGTQFLEMPLCHRRVVFLDAFRNAYHDMARKFASSQVEMTVSQVAGLDRTSVDRRNRQRQSSAASTATSDEEKPTKSRLERAIIEARDAVLIAPKAPPSILQASAASENEPTNPSRAEQNTTKDVLLLDSPAFFEEEAESIAPAKPEEAS